jgi:6-phosphofructokinase 1
MLAHGAAHAAFAGYTGVAVGLVNTHFVLLPIPLIIQATRKVQLGKHEACNFGDYLCSAHLYTYKGRNVDLDCPLSQVDPAGELWNRLRSSIGQPNFVTSLHGV